MKKIILDSGFTFDFTNLLGPELVTEDDLAQLEPRLTKIMDKAQKMRTHGSLPGHLSKDGMPESVRFPELPYVEPGNINTPESIERLKKLQDHARDEIDLVVNFGIGGSYLGNKVLFDVHCGEFWNHKAKEDRKFFPRVIFSGNNVDSRRTSDIIDYIKRLAHRKNPKFKVMLVVISKSGSTIETMSNFMIVQDALEKANIKYEVIAITDSKEGEEETLLYQLAKKFGWEIFSIPDGVGGRFSVFTEVGLVLGALIGFDFEAFLEGAALMDKACQSTDIYENPALMGATLKYMASEKYGRNIEVFMPYADYLKSTAEWYIQLLSESLGKVRKDKYSHYGRTPVVAVGTTDMHAQTQEHQEGRLNKIIQFVHVKKWQTELRVPYLYEEYSKSAAFSGLQLNDIMSAALEANAKALAKEHRFSATYELPELSPKHLGSLMFMLCWAIFFEGELANVDAFNQPGVEVYKKILGPKLKHIKEHKYKNE